MPPALCSNSFFFLFLPRSSIHDIFLHISALVSPLYFPPLDPKSEWKCVRTQQDLVQNFMSKTERQYVQMNLQQIYRIYNSAWHGSFCVTNSQRGWGGRTKDPNFFNCLTCSIIKKFLLVVPNVMKFMTTDKICHQLYKGKELGCHKDSFLFTFIRKSTEN